MSRDDKVSLFLALIVSLVVVGLSWYGLIRLIIYLVECSG